MHKPAVLALTAIGLATIPGCIIVATDHHGRPASKTELAAVQCVEPGQGPPNIRTAYRDQLSKLAPGMTQDQFREVLPDAVFIYQKEEDGHKLDAYSLKLAQPFYVRGEEVILTSHDEAWFYFKDGKFVRWGEPNQWP
jgi:hypothetical protein